VFNRWSETILGQVEIDERAAHEDSGGMNFLFERVFAIDEENAETLPGKQASTLKAGQSGADDSHVVARSHKRIAKSFIAQSRKTKKGERRVGTKCFASV
jgi:hypothetical protein